MMYSGIDLHSNNSVIAIIDDADRVVAQKRRKTKRNSPKVVRESGARRAGMYVLKDDEKATLDAAGRTGIASDADVAALWKRQGLA
jgi:predicted NBD/HSP70 family sugar kinase